MARVEVWETVVDGSGRPLSGATVDIYDFGTLNHSTAYVSEGGGAGPNPVTSVNGGIPAWVDEGCYDLKVSGAGITTTTRRFNAVKGGNPKLAAGQVTNTELAALSVATGNIQGGAVDNTKLAAAAVTAGKIAVGGLSASNQFAAGVVDTTALAAAAVDSTKLAAAAVIAGKIAVGGVSAANQFAAGVVDSTALGASAVTSGKIGAAAVIAGKIAAGGVSASNQFAASVVDNAALNLSFSSSVLSPDFQLSTSYQDVLSVTPAAGTYLIFVSLTADHNVGNTTNANVIARFSNDSIDRLQTRMKYDGDVVDTVTAGMFAVFTVGGATAITVQVRDAGGNNSWLLQTKTRMLYCKVGP